MYDIDNVQTYFCENMEGDVSDFFSRHKNIYFDVALLLCMDILFESCGLKIPT